MNTHMIENYYNRVIAPRLSANVRLAPTVTLLVQRTLLVLLLFTAFCAPWAVEAKDVLQEGDLIAICGDSITEQKLYSAFIEDYLLMCKPVAGVRAVQFGWGGETAGAFAHRMDNDVLTFKPSVTTICYGMNDGDYSPLTEPKAKMFRDNELQIVKRFKDAGVRSIVVGSPGVVDVNTWRKDPAQAEMYNSVLAALRDVAREVATDEGVVFANVHDPMMEVMAKVKAAYGTNYHFAGIDGVHPAANGHLVMAYAFLKALGCDGNIGTITVDLAKQTADARGGHKILSCGKGVVEIESSRYPFCFYGKPEMPESTRGVLPFLPFNEELNRFRLVVVGATAKRLNVTWGATTKTFSADDLAKGINLAAEFLDNPFSEPFRQVDKKVHGKQEIETQIVKFSLHQLPELARVLPDEEETKQRLVKKLVERLAANANALPAAVAPISHTITITEEASGK
jgi:lysophospholipase L1-like esterase